MSREIIEAVRAIEREKGIEENTLIHALEDARCFDDVLENVALVDQVREPP